METKLTCPVCDRPEIADNTCPNCETDLTLFRTLAELPAVTETAPPETKSDRRWLLVGIGALVVGISLGTFCSYLLFKPYLMAQLTTPAAEQVPIQPAPSQPNATQPQAEEDTCGGFNYAVKPGDSLSLIASRFYEDRTSWTLIAKANPQVDGRENLLEIGETLLIPNLEESCQ